jgi:hypothetical protein
LRKQAFEDYKNFDLHWLAYVGGPRESRRIKGDFILKGEDMVNGVHQPDACVPTTWDQDLHYPREEYLTKYPDMPYISRAEFGKHTDRKSGYPVPYRCLYSRDVSNLFMAGRDISVEREALGSTRVMRTCGMFGEVVGKAAWICLNKETNPRGVYESHLTVLQELMKKPGSMRRENIQSELVIPEDAVKLPEKMVAVIDIKKLEGYVLDDTQAALAGAWKQDDNLEPLFKLIRHQENKWMMRDSICLLSLLM